MSEGNKPTENNKPNNPNPEAQPTLESNSDATNADFKSTPAYQAMARQIADMKKAESDRLAAEEQARRDAEAKELEQKGEYEKALELQKSQLEEMQAKHAADILERDIKTALLKADCKNDTFIRGAIAGYKEGDIEEYVQGLAAAEDNKVFFGGNSAPNEPQGAPPPVGGNIGGNNNLGIKTHEDYVKALRSDDPKVVDAARAWGRQKMVNGLNEARGK